MVYQQNDRTVTVYTVHMLIAAFLNNTTKNHFIKRKILRRGLGTRKFLTHSKVLEKKNFF